MSFLLIAKMVLYGLVASLLRFILNLLFGPTKEQRESNGVLCSDILYDWRAFPLSVGPSYFTVRFRAVRDLDWLDRDDVTLFSVTEDEFYFVRTKVGVDIHDAEQYPFHYRIQHDTAVELGCVRREVVQDYLKGTGRLARKGDNISILHSIGRCGSTLMATMVNRTKQCRVISEPAPLMDIVDIITRKERAITRDATEHYALVKEVLLLLSPREDRKYFIKTHSQIINILPLISQVLPGIQQSYMHRALRPTISSFLRAFGGMGSVAQMEGFLMPQLPKEIQKIWSENRVEDFGHMLMVMTLANFYVYINETKDRTDIKSFTYEMLLENKEAVCKSYFKEIGIGEEFVSTALSAMEKDSQKNSAISRDKGVKMELRESVLKFGEKIGEMMGIELGGEDYLVVNVGNELKID